ncbi:hypothetical protein B296_00015394 [Ensete ventricosum]|uniref:Uncharacterized protein n=1 Tax=Ensete ventricosum TaxID=4639 RepID=A0A426ZQY8_ENSVE|nr:hypothetical protein B296_00015394 [Ensete ventricosum]
MIESYRVLSIGIRAAILDDPIVIPQLLLLSSLRRRYRRPCRLMPLPSPILLYHSHYHLATAVAPHTTNFLVVVISPFQPLSSPLILSTIAAFLLPNSIRDPLLHIAFTTSRCQPHTASATKIPICCLKPSPSSRPSHAAAAALLQHRSLLLPQLPLPSSSPCCPTAIFFPKLLIEDKIN